MSVPCPLPAPREHVQIERVRSHVLSVSPVLESLRMDSGAMVRVCGGMSLLMFACLSPGVCRSGFPNMPDSPLHLTESHLLCRFVSQLLYVVCK